MRILRISNQKELGELLRDIKVDPYGIKIMMPKAAFCLVRIKSISNIAANILKQEMLSSGGDAAIARDALTGKAKKTDCIVMGNLSQLNRLVEKLKHQPFGLGKLAVDIKVSLSDYTKDNFMIGLNKYKLNLGQRPYIMGILNLTPDSFSGDGLYQTPNTKHQTPNILDFVEKMVEDGADIIDVGGESSRPGAEPVAVKEELRRVIPAIKLLAKKIKVPISIDTYKPQVAMVALDNGAAMVNDITGLRDLKMAKVIARHKAGVVIMHMKGSPRTMQKKPVYKSLIDEVIEYLAQAIKRAQDSGIDKEKIIIDPGIGFGKTLEHNLEILKNLREFKVLGRPILAGTSRKSFIGKILNTEPQDRLSGTIASCILAVANGADIVRVHDVKEVKQALRVSEAILKCPN